MGLSAASESHKVRTTEMAELFSVIAPILERGDTAKIKVSGFSMYPLLSSRRDSVLLTKCDQVKVGDVPLYQRDDGSFVLHRIMREENGAYALMGDNELKEEYPVYPDQIVAVAKGFYRKERFLPCDGFLYRLYSLFWRKTVKWRPFLLEMIGRMAHAKRHRLEALKK